jgi:sugar-specific transcriptional regulator TrmB
MTRNEPVQALLAFGFTELEAEVYVFLLQESPATGYRVAQGIAKPVANTYKAIQSLQNKGAILVDEGASRLCRAVPAEELLAQLERNFQRSRKQAARALAALGGGQEDGRIYQLRSLAQVLERCVQMLDRAEELVVLDVFPQPLEELRASIEQTIARGVKVALHAYQPVVISGAEVFCNPSGPSIIERWPGQWLNLVVDGQEFLMALLNAEGTGIHQAIWSGSAYVAYLYYAALSCELRLGQLEYLLNKGATAAELSRAAERYRAFFKKDLHGYRKQLERLGKKIRAPDDEQAKRQ